MIGYEGLIPGKLYSISHKLWWAKGIESSLISSTVWTKPNEPFLFLGYVNLHNRKVISIKAIVQNQILFANLIQKEQTFNLVQ